MVCGSFYTLWLDALERLPERVGVTLFYSKGGPFGEGK
jgi:hypothetical protein